jgi:imidazole glycerol-phosphate synthase subunit HisH
VIAILDYGMGNLHSVARAVGRVGGDPDVIEDAGSLRTATALIVPGVGHFGTCMRALAERGLDRPLRDFVELGRPVFAVCLGMQVLFEGSDEDPAEGLGIIPGRSRRLPPELKVPHMGWNDVEWVDPHVPHPYVAGVPSGTKFYFVHSFAPDVVPGTTIGVSRYGRPFSAAVAHGSVFATQFHPEKSGDAGLRIYESFVKEANSA